MLRLALTIGDPQGIGPEIVLKGLQNLDAYQGARITIFGSLDALKAASASLALPFPEHPTLQFCDVQADLPGAVAYQAIAQAVAAIAADEADILVTGPISKKNLHDAGYDFPGHTEILEALAKRMFGTPDARAEMLFVYKRFRLLLLTRHVALKDVATAIAQPGAVARPIKSLIRFLRHSAKIDEPRIAILGLNPHAGENAGDEEKKYLMPVIHAVNGVGASVLEGCFAADAFFRDFDPETTTYDAIVAPYHDQGLIPFKLLAGFEAVNVTIGLPFLRTSVGHGTAEDIVGKGIAREDGLVAALKVALDLGKTA